MKDLSILADEGVKLNVRTTGVFENNGKILVHKCSSDGHYALPGGRIQATEDSIAALKREVDEELGLSIENISFMAVVENFFKVPEAKFHEYMWVIRGEFKDKSVYSQEKLYGKEAGKELIFEWMDINKLKDIDFRPAGVIPYIENMDGKIKHVITREY